LEYRYTPLWIIPVFKQIKNKQKTTAMHGRLNVQVTSVSVPSRGLGADSGGSAPVWARVVVARSTESWIDQATFSAEVGWRTKEKVENTEAEEEKNVNDNTPTEPFEFWPAPLPELLPEDCNDETSEEGAKQDPSWAWTAVSHVTPDVVRNAPTDSAASVWEQTLATLSDDDIACAAMDYLYTDYNGALPQCSGPIPLTRHHVTAVLNSSVFVEVYRGAERNPETDTLVGRAAFGSETWNGERLVGGEFSMARVLTYAGGVTVTLPLEAVPLEPNVEGEIPSPAFSEPASVELKVSADDALLRFCRGSRVFTCLVSGIPMSDDSGAVAIPEAWKIPCTKEEVKESDGLWESLRFSVACDLPSALSNDEGRGIEVGNLVGGQPYGYPVPLDGSEDDSTGASTTTDDGEDKEKNERTKVNNIDSGTIMSVNWSKSGSIPTAPATLMRAFLPKKEVEALVSKGKTLQDFPTSTPWSLVVTRSLFEGEENEQKDPSPTDDGADAERPPTPPGSNYEVPIPLISTLTTPGTAYINGRFVLKDITGTPFTTVQDNDALEEEVEEGDIVRRVVSTIGPELMLYAQFNSPLVAAPPPPPEPVLMPSDIVAARPPAPRAPPESAAKILRNEVRAAATSIVSEIYNLFGSDLNISSNTMSADQRRRQLLYHLNTGGAYHALREKLKHSMGRLVKERFPAEAALAPGSIEHGKFISELYVFLMEEVFCVINNMFAESAGGPTISEEENSGQKDEFKTDANASKDINNVKPPTIIGLGADSAVLLGRLGDLAKEAELSGDLNLALRYHQDRVVASEDAAERRHVRQVEGGGAQPWIDYAAFAARCGDYPKADECCREAIALSLPESATSTQSGDADPSALMMQSALMSRNGEQDMAKIMLSPLTTEDNPDPRACTMLSIIHLRCDRETKKAEKAMKRAVKGATNSKNSGSRFDLYHDLAIWLLCRGLGGLTHFVLGVAAREGCTGTDNESNAADDETVAWTATNMSREQRVEHLWIGGATSLASGDLERAEKLLKSAIEVEEANGQAWSVLGHVLAKKHESSIEAINAFQTALPLLEKTQNFPEKETEVSFVIPELPVAQLGQLYHSLGFLYLQKGTGYNAGAAKEVYLRACRLEPTSTSWLGAGIAAFELKLYSEAEDALAEANILNNQNPQIWGYLALLCLQSTAPRVEEADQSLNQAIRLGLKDPSLLERIGSSYASLGCYRQAESTLRRSAGIFELGSARKLLGDVLSAQNRYEDALQEYETVLAGESADVDKRGAEMGKTRMLKALGKK
jgi:tetratricopeptide (TPR) repeat protein